ncbi:hypothetical protein OYE22_09100 [Streptomyces sp. 71268]|uniref:hypothetical protein n=1 Tax=Streptomyces sp. 71268 TaxID=3002640 RepID=UPI0023F8EB84|nr:hypothetical protein [Streptomyces sp. 71268]WEV25336.1 hypothetical protein OYE22_09100 [Streptomyces sp. 71268]
MGEHLMTLRVYRRRPGEVGPPDPASAVVSVTAVDSERVWRDDYLWAATSAWPPCRCPIHRRQHTSGSASVPVSANLAGGAV